ncbi:DUF2970 domain-containing protein [Paludibacterium paludis]|uniref:DUF2970 domain-containing protein n=1 Tax=Paludibacterium paludis TaxID=1225769 RepID=A0A918P2A1_9NEIS|nr:DUF2970 domain-containing protein [Paludibacterium paludis]GGY15496.1 hypothetical protein GCM10011289_18450 [Paludibacterium paludis]
MTGVWRAIGAVLSAFFGVRKSGAAARDVRLPVWQIAVGVIVLLGGFIAVLLFVVSWAVRNAAVG